jgi:putative DNA primase/helicase
MVALVSRPGHDGVHRTWLKRDGSGKAEIDKPKMALSSWAGGAIKLSPPARVLGIAEGIETAPSAWQLTGIPCWSAMASTNLAAVGLPDGVREVHCFVDRDENEAGLAQAWIAVGRWMGEGREWKLHLPSEPHNDYNDLLMGGRP